MKLTLRALAALLGYPSAELQAHLGEIRSALASDGVLPIEARERLEPLLTHLEHADLLDAQAAYSDLFDRSRSLSLYLFEHVYGESRERGQAMVTLGQMYQEHGFVMTTSELPDFLPVFLEFVSCLPAHEARQKLSEPAHVLAALHQRLTERESLYAGVFFALLAAVDARPDPHAIAELRAQAGEDKSLDEEWEEAPVDFRQPVAGSAQESGIVARIHAAQIALSRRLRS